MKTYKTPQAAVLAVKWPNTPYCAGQIAFVDGDPREAPSGLTGGASDDGAGEWYFGYDEATAGRFYGFRSRDEIESKVKSDYPVLCHVCPHGEDKHFRVKESRLIGSSKYGGLWHCPKHNHPDLVPETRASCGCPAGDYTDQLPRPEMVEAARVQREENARWLANFVKGKGPDIYGRTWDLPGSELCEVCGQPDNCGDCNHEKLSDDDVRQLGGVPS